MTDIDLEVLLTEVEGKIQRIWNQEGIADRWIDHVEARLNKFGKNLEFWYSRPIEVRDSNDFSESKMAFIGFKKINNKGRLVVKIGASIEVATSMPTVTRIAIFNCIPAFLAEISEYLDKVIIGP